MGQEQPEARSGSFSRRSWSGCTARTLSTSSASTPEEIVASSGTQFDPEVGEALPQVLGYDRPEKAVSAAGAVASTNR